MAKNPRDPSRHTPPSGQRPTELEGDGKGPSASTVDSDEANAHKTGLEGGQPAAATEQKGRSKGGSPGHHAAEERGEH